MLDRLVEDEEGRRRAGGDREPLGARVRGSVSGLPSAGRSRAAVPRHPPGMLELLKLGEHLPRPRSSP
ncbi:MAG TPA: hypothetical protein EYP33_01745 [Pyrodictium sp.]|nr:hypothetical protein [Pyrodictium sp.]